MKGEVFLDAKDVRFEEFEKTINLAKSVIKRLTQKCEEMPLSEILSQIKNTKKLVASQMEKMDDLQDGKEIKVLLNIKEGLEEMEKATKQPVQSQLMLTRKMRQRNKLKLRSR